jgi:hypothetical protein
MMMMMARRRMIRRRNGRGMRRGDKARIQIFF